jgi:cytoskeleton protein RodZ
MAVEVGGIGARLRAGREKLGLTVLQTAERLHTDARIVDAIEAEDFATLGAPVYARGHIKHYAELVGESTQELTALYTNSSRVAQPDLTQIAKAPPLDDSTKLVAPALLVIAVFAVAGAIWWVSALSNKKPRLSETHVVGALNSDSSAEPASGESEAGSTPAGDVAESTAPATANSNAPAADVSGATTSRARQVRGGAAGATSGSSSGSAAVAARAGASIPAAANSQVAQGRAAGATSGTTAQGRGVGAASDTTAQGRVAGAASGTATQGRAGSAVPVPTAQSRTAASGTRVAAAPPAQPAPAGASTITLRYSADSWTEVYDASGTRLFYDVGAANSVQSFSGTYPLRVVLGNASGVSVEFNGRNESIANLLHPDGSAQFSINRSGRIVRARPVADGG